MHHEVKSKGFTLIELMLAMSFIAVLLLAIALTIIQISNVYNHGLTLKDVNQAGATVSSSLQNTISSSKPFPITGGSSRYVEEKTSGVVTGGRLCLGGYSYIWNLGSALDGKSPSLNTYSNSSKQIYFVQAVDAGANYCLSATSSKYSKIDASNSVDLLAQGDHALVPQSFAIYTSPTGTDSQTAEEIYTIDFTIGTNEQSALTTNEDGDLVCRPPSDIRSDATFCALSEFNIVVRAGNSVQ